MTILSFYEKPILLDRNAHRNLRLKTTPSGLKFAAKSVALPIAPAEFPHSALEFPIVFAVNETGSSTPIGLFGVRENENLFIDENGVWQGFYIPAFIRRYPFVLNVDPTSNAPYVLIDEAFDGISETEGERLFEEDGKETAFMKSTLEFLSDFMGQSEQAGLFVETLKKHDLLIPQQVVFTRSEDESYTLDGFHIVDEKRLSALSDEVTLQLARSGDLARIHTHLLSLNNIHRVVQRLAGKPPRPHKTAA
jgi:hypothetical protein